MINLRNEIGNLKEEIGGLKAEVASWKKKATELRSELMEANFFQLCEENYQESTDSSYAWARRFGYGTGLYRENPFKWFAFCNSDGNLLFYLSIGIELYDFQFLGIARTMWYPESECVAAAIEFGNNWITNEPIPSPTDILKEVLTCLEGTEFFSDLILEKVYPFVGW